ncbi:MAG: HlyC/CorC family transporter [Chloroflexi bacterium]|nr:HlyC/CorC family transporter [Chloroflexota bacterium]
MGISTLLLAYILGLGILVFFAAAELAFAHVRTDRLERLLQQEVPGITRVDALLSQPHQLSAAFILGRSGASVLIASSAILLSVSIFSSSRLWAGFLVGPFAALLGILLALSVSHLIARQEPERFAALLAGPLAAFMWFARPLARLLAQASETSLLASWGERLAAEKEALASEASQAEAAATDSEDQERRILRTLLDFQRTTVREIMVPRMDIVAIEASASIRDVEGLISQKGFSRIPIYEGALDNVVGLVYARDLWSARAQDRTVEDLRAIARKPLFVPETKRLDELLRDFQALRVHLAVIIDEYGAVAGLVTLEDVVEEIVGEIEDEFHATGPQVERTGDEESVVDATVSLDVINDLFGTRLEGEGFNTLGGLLYHHLGKVPVPGESIAVENLEITVLSTIGRRVRKARIRRVAPAEAS